MQQEVVLAMLAKEPSHGYELRVRLARALGPRVVCVFVDNGLLRAGERAAVVETFGGHSQAELRVVARLAADTLGRARTLEALDAVSARCALPAALHLSSCGLSRRRILSDEDRIEAHET